LATTGRAFRFDWTSRSRLASRRDGHNMMRSLLNRISELERHLRASRPFIMRYGWLKRLPDDFVGERHIMMIKCEPTDETNKFWEEYEERPGPPPLGETDDGAFTVYLTREPTQLQRVNESGGQ